MRWMLLVVVLLILALAFRLGFLAYALYVLLGSLLASRILTQRWSESIQVKRECNQQVAQVGDTVTVLLSVRNTGSLPIAWLLVEDLLPRSAMIFNPPNLQFSGRRITMMMLKSQDTKTLLYQLKCNRRGYYPLGPAICETGDLFGLHRRYLVAAPAHYLTVYPDVVPLQGYDIASKRPLGEVVVTHRLFEDPTRIAGVRQYQAGDPLNRVHWRATARTGLLHSKVYEPSSVAGSTLLMDFHRDSHAAHHEPFRSELAVTAAASIANALYLAGQQLGLVTNGRDAADRIRESAFHTATEKTRKAARADAETALPSTRLRPVSVETRRGPDQFLRILETLARLELTDGLRLPELIAETASRLPRDATIIAIVPRVTAEIAITLGNLHRQGFSVTALVNLFEEEEYASAAGLLIPEGVSPRHLKNRESIAQLCERMATASI